MNLSIASEGIPLQISRDGNALIVKGLCSEVEAQTQPLSEWKVMLGEEPPFLVSPTEHEDETPNICTKDIASIVPKFVKELHGTKTWVPGPNCFNTALVLSKVVPALRFVSENELYWWLYSPLCSPLGQEDSPRPGDIVVVSHIGDIHTDLSIDHVQIYLSENLTFAKMGTNGPYSLMSALEGARSYGVDDPSCLKHGSNHSGCRYHAEYRRCISTEEYLAKLSQTERESLNEIRQRIYTVECSLVENQSTANVVELTRTRDVLAALAVDLNEQLHQANPDCSKEAKYCPAIKPTSLPSETVNRIGLLNAYRASIPSMQYQLNITRTYLRTLEPIH